MKSIVRIAAAGISLLLALTGTARSQATDVFDPTDRIVVASRIYALVQQYFAHWAGAPRVDVERAYREYVGDVIHGATRRDFGLATLRFVAALHNGHTQFLDSQMDGRPLKFRLVEIEGQWVVLGSQDKRLDRGAIVRTLAGRPVEDFVRDSARYVAASNDRLARTHVFSYPALFPERVPIGLASGDVVVIDRAAPADAPPLPMPGVEGRWIQPGEVAYIRVASFGDPGNERKAIDFVRQFASSRSLVVDVRGNGGGATPRQLTAALINRPWRFWQDSTPQRNALAEAQGLPPMFVSRDNPVQTASPDAYQGSLFLLIDRFCGSACEDFVMPFKATGRAVLIGETTQGSSGNPYRTDLGNGMSVSIGAVRYRFPDGSAFEGVGIAPDVSIERRIADIVAGRDVVMARAQELAAAAK
jgi:carboxyl-terminal processing protease